MPLLPGGFVTTEAGTGFVHIAPGHGEDDFALGKAHGLPVPETVNDDGTFTEQAPGFAGLHVFKAHDAVYAACGAAVCTHTSIRACISAIPVTIHTSQ